MSLRGVLLLAVILAFSISSKAQCNCAWAYKVPITITNSGATTLTNYQVSITLNTSALVTAGKMISTGDDIRFTDGSCTNLPYWIESGMNTPTTVIWINVNSIAPSTTTTINLYYGNPAATAASNGNATFLLFDDFTGGSLDLSKWTPHTSGTGAITVSGGIATFNTAGLNDATIVSNSAFAAPVVSEMKVNAASGSWPNMYQMDNGVYTNGAGLADNAGTMFLANSFSGCSSYGANSSFGSAAAGSMVGQWSLVRTASSATGTWPGGSLTSGTIPAPTLNQQIALGLLCSGIGNMQVDWVRARQYYATGTTQSLGAEVQNSATISGTQTVCVGSNTTLTPSIGGGTWTSGSTGYATVGSSSGVVTGVSAGTVNISYTTAGGCVSSVVVTVNATPNPITGVFGVCVGGTTNLVESIGGGTWSSGSPAIASVGTSTGTVTGNAPGSSLITYAFGTGCSVSQTVTVEANPASAAYTVSPNPVCQGTSTTFSSGATPCSVNMLLFNGNNSQASLGAPITTAIDNVTMEAYISWSGTTANNQYIMLNGTTTASGYGLYMPAGSNQLAINIGGVATLTSAATIPIGPWTHVAAVRSSGTWSVYVNGVQFTVSSSGTTPNTPATNFRVGSSQNANEAFNGAIDEGKFWNVARTTSQIQSDMNACNTFPQSNLLGYWRFDEVAGTSAADASANGNTLTESNIAHGGSVNLNISTYSWNFGDGGTATTNNVGHTYATSSNFSSSFTLTNSNGCSLGSSTVVTVNPLPSAIGGTPIVCVGGTTTLSNTLPGGTWSSLSPGNASVGAGTGIVTGNTGGTTAVIQYTSAAGCVSSITVTVNANPAAIGGTFSACVGLGTTLTDGSGPGTWTSDNTTIATIGSSGGTVTGVSAGTTFITYTMNATGCFATQAYTVNPNPAAISGTLTVCNGATTTLNDATSGGTWSSLSPANASVGSASGIVTGNTANTTAVIQYTLPTGCLNSATVTVNPNPSAITGTASVCTGFTTTLSSGPGTTTWSTSDPTIATVGASTGVVTGVAAGVATISFTLATGCYAVQSYTVNQNPAATTGNPFVCVGQTSALSDAVAGGTWSASNGNASVGASSGVVTGNTAGNVNIVYTMPTGCSATTPFTVNGLPAAIGGATNVCVGSSTTLTDASTPGNWASSNSTIGSIGSSSGTITGVSAGNITITYALNATGCYITAPFTVNVTPAAITGSSTVCTGATTTLADATTGGTWSASNGNASVGAGTGIVTGVTAGNVNIIYTLTPGNCTATFPMTVNQTPAAMGGANNVCVGSTTNLTDATAGGTWSTTNTAVGTIGASGSPTTVGGISAGTITISYTMPTGCYALLPFTVNPTPAPITGGLVLCANSTTSLSDVTGGGTWTSSNISWATVGSSTGVVTGVSSGTVVRNPVITYTLAAGCTATATLTVNPAPDVSNFTSPTSTSPCQGANATVTVNSTTLGVGTFTVTYNLSGANSATAATSTLTMTGSSGTFSIPASLLPNTGSTTVTITLITNSFGCNSTVSSSNTASFTVNILPTAYNVLGTGSYCAGGSGIHVFVSNSVGGVNYQLYLGGSPVGIPIGGTFSALDMGAQTTAGTYTVIGTNTTTLCSNNMTGSAVISINPLPTAFAVTGGGSYCAGGSGVSVGLANSTIGVSYQLLVGGVSSGSAVSGTGGVITFGTRTAAGTYTVLATNSTTGCQNTMSGSVTIIVNPLPAAITGTLNVCPGLTTTLSSATSGGTWTSVNTAAATVGSNTGIVTGVASGTSLISYTLTSTTGCTTTATVTVNSLPAAITGTGVVCSGATLPLADATGGGLWTSSNTSEAQVGSASGVVTGVAAGTPTITYALSTGCIATTVVTVNNTPAAVTGLSAVCVGSTITLSDITSSGSWSSSNTTFATVGAGTGVVTGVAAGSATISYTVSGCSALFPIVINPVPAPIAGTFNVCATQTTTLTDPSTGGNWSSSNNSLATVSGTGVVSGVAAGNPIITYTLPATGCFATTPFTVNTMPAGITGTGAICVGSTLTLNDANPGGTWTSSNTALATVTGTASGVVTGVGAGLPTITYMLSAGSCFVTTQVTVNANPAAITGSNQVCFGQTTTLADGTTGGTWSSSNTSIASVSGSGVVSGVAAGSATISYTLSSTGCFATFPMTVNPLPANITGPNNVCTGFTIPLADATTGGTWSSSSTAQATVSGTGVVTGVAAGTPTITYSVLGCVATAPITVNATPVAIVGTFALCTGASTTLSDASGGGTWSSSDLTKATVGSTTGTVTGVAAGNPNISYISAAGCFATVQMTINTQPGPITGLSTVCTGATTPLNDGTAGGNWTSSNTAVATISGGGLVSGLTAGTTTIAYTMAGGCNSTFPMTVNQTPAAISGASAVCVGLTTTLTDASTGGTWSASNAFATVGSVTGVVTGVSAGTLNISYTLPGGCSAIKPMTVNPVPAAITGSPIVCANSTVTIADATPLGTWSSSNIALATIGSSSGTITGISAGNPVFTYALTATGCYQIVVGTINPLPALFSVTGGGAYCAGGTGAHVGLSGSTFGINYQLVFNGVTNIGTPVAGNNSPLDFGLQTTAGTYTVVATNASTGCTIQMTGSALISVNPVPTAFLLSSAGGGSYCAGTGGATISLSASQSGVSYQLFFGGFPSGAAVNGLISGGSISFGVRTVPGAYTAVATNTVTACTANMTGIASISILPLPNVYTVTGGGAYCAGGSGVAVGISNSDIGINYQLQNAGVNVGAAVAGTGTALSFGPQTLTGTYTVIATNTTTGCTITFPTSVTISINALPNNTYTVTGTGSYCAGGTGLAVGLSNSQSGVNYQLLYGGSALGSPVGGTTGSAITFGLQTGAGTYTVVGTNATTGCSATMTGSAVITINALPNTYTVSGGGGYCAGSGGPHVFLSFSDPGVSYQLQVGGVNIGPSVPGSSSPLDFGAQTTAGTYTVVAQNTTTLCTNNMIGSAIIIINALPNAYTVSGTGSYCAGGAGLHVGLSSSDLGVNYQLMLGTAPVGAPLAGTGSSLDFGAQTASGTYTIVATNPATGCVNTMTGSAIITITALPALNNVTGGGSYCAGGTGVTIGLNGSVPGNTYQLINAGGPVGSPLPGIGSPLSYTGITAAGTYSVVATSTSSGCTNTMNGSATVVINPLPALFNVTGGGSYCAGSTGVAVGLNGSTVGVSYQLLNGTTFSGGAVTGTGVALNFGIKTAPGVYTVKATDPIYGCSNIMNGSSIVTVNALPVAFNVTGGGAYCAGGSGVHVGLSNSTAGVSYQLKLGGVALGLPVTGTGASLDLGLETLAGVYTITATDLTTGCTNNMTGSVTIAINASPAIFTVSGGGSYCAGGTGVAVGLTGSALNVRYQLFNGASPVGAPVNGILGAISFGPQTSAGTYTAIATDNTSGCTSNMTGSVSVIINALPTAYAVTGGGSYCTGGTGVHIGSANSDPGVSYQLYRGSITVGSPIAGTGSSIDFGLQTVAGVYTVIATNTSTLCTKTMSGSATVSINPLPTAYNVTGGGSYCAGGTGLSIGLNGSNVGVNYQLYLGGAPVGLVVIGTGSILDFGVQTAAGAYTVVATMASTGCTNNMTGSASITVNAAPTAYAVTGGGSYCAGGAGVHVGIGGSDAGVSYQLYRGTALVGSPMGGTGLAVDFGLQTTPGLYTVVATNNLTGCTNNMTGSTSVIVDPLPAVFTVTGGGSYCAGGTGFHVGLSGSAFGFSYQLYNDGVAVGLPLAGTGSSLDFGVITIAGNYTVVASAPGSLCAASMAGSATIVVNAMPNIYTVTGGGSYCPGGAGMPVGLSGSDTGVNYKLYRGTALVATMPGNDSTIDFGLQTVAGAYSIVAVNATSGCTDNMTGSATVVINTLPTVYTVGGGGTYCASGFGVHVTLNNSDPGVNYQLYRGSSAVGSPMAGTGAMLDLGIQSFAGTYTVTATNATTGCTSNMTGTAVIAVNPLPTVYTVTGGGSYCAGGTAPHVMVSSSATGINYQLYRGGVTIGSPMAGTGSPLDFGAEPTAGSYTVIATDHFTGCSSTMLDTVTVASNPLPLVYSVIGGGSYCAGGTGLNVAISNSQLGISYQLLRDGGATGSSLAGTGLVLNFGLQTAAGVYTVVATNTTTGCTNNMTGSATIAVNALPTTHLVTGGGSYCSGGTGADVGLNGSASGISYQLKMGATSVGAAMPGTGSVLDFGLQTTAGSYTVVATNSTTGCSATMTDSAVVTINSLPVPHSVTGGGNYCSGTSGIAVGLGGSNTGVNYQLYNGSLPMGSPVAGTGSPITFGLQTLAGTYTVKATNASTGCMANMTGSTNVTVITTVVPAVTLSTGVGDTVCAGTTVTFTAVSTNAGTSPSYNWTVNSTAIPAVTSGSYTYIPMNGDVISVQLNSSATCAIPATASNTLTMTALVNQTPTVTIYAAPGDSLCGATPVTMTLSSTWAGPDPAYRWFLNGAPMAGGATFNLTPNNGDVVFVTMSSSYKCVSDTSVLSNNIGFSVDHADTPLVSITDYHNASFDSFRVTINNDPTMVYNYTYDWYINGSLQPLVTTRYLLLAHGSVPFGSQITCVVTRRNRCGVFPGFATVDLVESAGITPVTAVMDDIRLIPNPNKGLFTLKGSLGTQDDQEVNIEITDMLGQVVYSTKFMARNGAMDQHFNMNGSLANGMYILNMHSAAGNKVFHVVVEQ